MYSKEGKMTEAEVLHQIKTIILSGPPDLDEVEAEKMAVAIFNQVKDWVWKEAQDGATG